MKIKRVNIYVIVIPRSESNPYSPVNRHRQDKATVVVGMFTNQIYPAWCPNDKGWDAVKPALEFIGNPLVQIRHELRPIYVVLIGQRLKLVCGLFCSNITLSFGEHFVPHHKFFHGG